VASKLPVYITPLIMSSMDIFDHARECVSWDPCAETRDQIQTLLERGDGPALEALLSSRQAFGTAGLRGPMCPGYAGLNYLVVLQTTQGLVRYLQKELGEEATARQGVVIGYDHRKLGDMTSKGFGELCARVFAAAGIKVYLYEDIVATPLVPYAVNKLHTAAGIMVTASHNPKRDNGYKLYWGNGVQIIPPHDSGIYGSILENLAPWQDYSTVVIPTTALDELMSGRSLREFMADSYMVDQKASILGSRAALPASGRQLAYTAMHGVGKEWVIRAFAEFNLSSQLNIVPQQANPDPEFPTVVFPNPEEKGALTISMAFADENACDVIIANDPDADRLGAAEKQADGWKVFTGNEIGAMLGHFQIMKHKARAEVGGRKPAVLASVVSSRMLEAMAKAEGVMYADTLTGFKWLGNESLRVEKEHDAEVLFLYEEALGYCIGGVVHDKDGISGAVCFTEMVNQLHTSQGFTLKNYLDSLYEQYGQFQSNNAYVICHDPVVTASIFERLRSCGSTPALGKYFDKCGDVSVSYIRDVTQGVDVNGPADMSPLPATPGSEMILFVFDNHCTVTLRTSGTEPKIKYYIEMGGRPGMSKEEVVSELMSFSEQVIKALLQPDVHTFG
jgi:phosphomannomutase